MKTAVMLLAHGTPASREEMGEFLRRVMGRPPSPELVEQMHERYRIFGGSSPLLDITRRQAAALERVLGLPVLVGMKYSRPFIEEARRGWDRIIDVAMAPHRPEAYGATCGPWHTEPALIEVWARRIDGSAVLFTAHTVRVQEAEPYRTRVMETIRAILERVGPVEWDLAWQSRPVAPGQWLGPDVDTVLRRRRWRSVLVAPIGFVCDHAEVLYDIDHLHRRTAEELGMRYRRTPMPNDDPKLIEALATIVRRAL